VGCWAGGSGVGESVGGGAGFDDLSGEGQAVDDGRTQAWVGEGFCPGGERLVGGDRDGRAYLALGENLEQQLRAAAVQLQVPHFLSQEST